MEQTTHDKADVLREQIKETSENLRRIEDSIDQGDTLPFSVIFKIGGYFKDFSYESMTVALIFEKQRLSSKLKSLEKEYANL